MSKKSRLSNIFSLCITLAMMMLMVFPSPVLAEDEAPPADGTPAEGSAPVEVELVATPTLTPAEEVVEETAQPEEDQGTLAEVVEALSEDEAVLVNESGEEIPLASEEAADALTYNDPWFQASPGVIVGYCLDSGSGCTCAPLVTECHQVSNPVQAAIDDARSTGTDITLSGTYYEQVSIIGKNVNLIGATSGGGLAMPGGTLNSNGDTSAGTSLFSLLYIEGGTVNIQGLSLSGAGNSVTEVGADPDYYVGVTFNSASGSVVTSTISDFYDNASSDTGIGVLVIDSSGVHIAQNIIKNTETGVLVDNSSFVAVEHNEIKNAKTNDEWTKTAGIDIQNSAFIDISNNTIFNIEAKSIGGTRGNMRAYGININNSSLVSVAYNTIYNVTASHATSEGYGLHINDSALVSVECNTIYNNEFGIGIDESSNWSTGLIGIHHNNVYDNEIFNLTKDTKAPLDIDWNYWGVDYWPNPGGWDGENVDEGHWEEQCYMDWVQECVWVKIWWIFGYYDCEWVQEEVCEDVWISNWVWHDGFKQLAKLDGVSFGEVHPVLFDPNCCANTTLDYDADGVFQFDNCPWDYNPDQADLDNDGIGDVCDDSQLCAAGTFYNASTNTCDTCAAGTYSGVGATSCTPCAAGTYSGAGAAECTLCAAGTFSGIGAEACTPCAAGTYSGIGAAECTPCAAGSYSGVGAAECTLCAAGTYSGAGAAECTPCADGYISGEGAEVCTICEAGTYENGLNTACIPCDPGYVSDAGAVVCDPCAAGTYETDNTCIPCAAGSYTAEEAQTECTLCERGKFNDEEGSTRCYGCEPGSYTGALGSTSCKLCEAGKYGPNFGMEECLRCPEGQTSDPGATVCYYEGEGGEGEGIVPVTGGQLVEIPCDRECVTLQLPDGSQVEFCGLCGYSASLADEYAETIPFDMPEGVAMVLGMTVNLFDENGDLLLEIPAGATVKVSYPLGAKAPALLGIQLWDPANEEWVSLLDLLTVPGRLEAYIEWPGTSLLVE